MRIALSIGSAAVLVSAVVLSACTLPLESSTTRSGCTTDSECSSSSSGCLVGACVHGACGTRNAPAGSIPTTTTFSAPSCHRIVCDDMGNELVTIDKSAVPTSSMTCQKSTCDDTGNVATTPDPTNVPPEMPHDCKKNTCDATGHATTTIDDADVPLPGACTAYTCSGGNAMSTPANQGKSCGGAGFVCGSTGACDTCPTPDAQCTDTGPAASARSMGTAHDFGDTGWCDGDGLAVCGALSGSAEAWFTYHDDGSGSLCEYDPFVAIQATAPVSVCEWFSCPSVQCPAGTTSDTNAGHPGCCMTGVSGTMKINPSCSTASVWIRVKAQGTCGGYEMGFHS